MRTIAIINQKGGCGKTTCSINLAAALAQEGQRTLLVDMDPQSHCALGLAVPETQIRYSSAELMRAGLDGSLAVEDVVWQIARFFDLVPSSMALAAIEAQLQHAPDKDRRLGQVLSTVQDKYDFCIIDCPPSIGLLTFNALRAATEVIVPVETGYFSMEGAKKQHRTIEMLARRAGHNVQFSILPTMYDVRTKLAREILSEIKRHFTGHLLPMVINFNAKLKEAASFGQPITEYDATSRGMQDFEQLAQHLVANPPLQPEQPAVDPQQMGMGQEADNPAMSRAAELVERARMLSQRTAEISQRLATPQTPTTPQTPAASPSPVVPGSVPQPMSQPVPQGSNSSAMANGHANGNGHTNNGHTPAGSQPSVAASHLPGEFHPKQPQNGMPAGYGNTQPTPATPQGVSAAQSRLQGIMAAAGLTKPAAPAPAPTASPASNTPDYETGFYAPAAHQQPVVQPSSDTSAPNHGSMSPAGANGSVGSQVAPMSPPGTGTGTGTGSSTLVAEHQLKAQIPENMDPRIADLYGVRKTSQGLLFVQPVNSEASQMAIAGDFNGWNPQQTRLKLNETHNVWQAVIPVPPGRYRYRLVVDGKWVKDPYNHEVETNPFGELNNVIVVKA